jgi:hypothetical protein
VFQQFVWNCTVVFLVVDEFFAIECSHSVNLLRKPVAGFILEKESTSCNPKYPAFGIRRLLFCKFEIRGEEF